MSSPWVHTITGLGTYGYSLGAYGYRFGHIRLQAWVYGYRPGYIRLQSGYIRLQAWVHVVTAWVDTVDY